MPYIQSVGKVKFVSNSVTFEKDVGKNKGIGGGEKNVRNSVDTQT